MISDRNMGHTQTRIEGAVLTKECLLARERELEETKAYLISEGLR